MKINKTKKEREIKKNRIQLKQSDKNAQEKTNQNDAIISIRNIRVPICNLDIPTYINYNFII